MFRRALGSLLEQRFSPPRATPTTTAAARSLHSSLVSPRPFVCFSTHKRSAALGSSLAFLIPIGSIQRHLAHGRRGLAAAALAAAGGGTLAVQHFKKGTAAHDESAHWQGGDLVIDDGVITWELHRPDMKKRVQRWIRKASKGYKAYRDDQEKLRMVKADLESMEQLPPCDCDKHLRMMACPEGIDQAECDDLFMEFFAMHEKAPREELDKMDHDDIARSIMAIYEKRRAGGMEASREAVRPLATQDSS